jgi:endonuclease YncB( thermonuclease family)
MPAPAARDVLSLTARGPDSTAERRLPARAAERVEEPGASLRGSVEGAAVGRGMRGAFRRLRFWPLPLTWRARSATRHGDIPVARRRFGGRTALIGLALLVALPLIGLLGASLIGDVMRAPPREAATPRATTAARPDAAAPAPPPAEAAATGTIRAETPTPGVTGALRGVAEVLDTATLNVAGKVVRLFGVEWAKGAGEPDDLAAYLRGREVTCRPEGKADRYRCEVAGQDLSKVVLFNGGGLATPDATPELKAAEDHAKAQQLGVWGADRVRARP